MKLVSLIVPVFGVVGSIFIAFGIKDAWASWSLFADAQRAEGKVVEMAPSKGARNSTIYAPVFQYKVGGETYRVRGQFASSRPAYGIGDKVTVLYTDSSPAEGVVDSFSELWLPSIVFVGCGLLFGLVGFSIRAWRGVLTKKMISPR
jgi:hypothetical protein